MNHNLAIGGSAALGKWDCFAQKFAVVGAIAESRRRYPLRIESMTKRNFQFQQVRLTLSLSQCARCKKHAGKFGRDAEFG